MDLNAYGRLTHIITNAIDSHASVSNNIDMDDLWDFFFESGFIYPMKYRLMQSQREDFKETYRKLYKERQDVATHFTYKENGRIYERRIESYTRRDRMLPRILPTRKMGASMVISPW
jgi:hypothetical protein